MEAVEFSMDSDGARLSMVPYVMKQAQVDDFKSKFWVETVKDTSGNVKYNQLQYAQFMNLAFESSFTQQCRSGSSVSPEESDCLIKWPH